MGSRNLNVQAKLLITQPSMTSYTQDLDIMSPSAMSSNNRYTSHRQGTNMTLPALSSPRANEDSLSLRKQPSKDDSKLPFELQPQQKSAAIATILAAA